MTKVKICGITNIEDARQSFESGADQIGLNFYPKSVRYIPPDEARRLVESLPEGWESIGVFVNETIDTVLETADHVGLAGIQLHGDEDAQYVRDLTQQTSLFIIKAFCVSPLFGVSDALEWKVRYQLFDTYSPNGRGGTGKTFDWKNMGVHINQYFPYSAYLAGGLTPENVKQAIRDVKPYAVDVASGVEASPGKKDPNKVASFIKAAKEAI